MSERCGLMDATESKKSIYASSIQPDSPFDSEKNKIASYTDGRENMASVPLQEKSHPTRIDITWFAESRRLNGTLSPPGSPKSYHQRNSSSSRDGTKSKPHLTESVRLGPSNGSSGLAATNITSLFEKWRTEENGMEISNSGGLGSVKNQGDSDSEEDGGVKLASSLAVFMQGPGDAKVPLRSMTPRTEQTNEQRVLKEQEEENQKPEQHMLEQKDYQEPKIDVLRKPSLKPRSSMASQMAALLQTPGVLNFVSHRSSAPKSTTSFPTPVYHARLVKEEEGREGDMENEDGSEKEESEKEERSVNAEIQNITGKPRLPFEQPPSQANEILDPTRYWRNPNASSVYRRSTSPPTPIAQEESSIPLSSRRVFRHLKDGDIVGDEASELPKANKGRLMMKKMGYKEGTPLGNGDSGLMEPVKVEIRLGNRGLGLAKKESRLPTRASTSQVNLSQMIPTQMIPAGISGMNSMNDTNRMNSFQQTSYGITQQFQQMNIIAPQQAIEYSLATPLSAYQIRLRMVQILSYLDDLELLDIVDHSYIIALSINKVTEGQLKSRLGCLMEIDLVQIVTREYNMAVLRKEYGGGDNRTLGYGNRNKGDYW